VSEETFEPARATGGAFDDDKLIDKKIEKRIQQVADDVIRFTINIMNALQKNKLSDSTRTQIHGAADKIEDSTIYRQVLDADYASDERMIPQCFRIEANH
jgi:hypothetical protein